MTQGLLGRQPRSLRGVMKSRSPRMSDIARGMRGKEGTNYKTIQRFLGDTDPREVLLRLFQEEAAFCHWRSDRDAASAGEEDRVCWHFERWRIQGLLADVCWPPPIMGEPSLVVLWITHPGPSIKMLHPAINITLQPFGKSRNYWEKGLWYWIGSSVYLELLENLVAEGTQLRHSVESGSELLRRGRQASGLECPKRRTRILNKLFYKGKVFVNVIGYGRKVFPTPLWSWPNLMAEEGLAIYLMRMKIEQAFRDLKSLLNLHKLMNKRRMLMEKMVALILITYSLPWFVGETLRNPNSSRIIAGRTCFFQVRLSSWSSNMTFHLPCFPWLYRPSTTHFACPNLCLNIRKGACNNRTNVL